MTDTQKALDAYELIISQIPSVEWMHEEMRKASDMVRAALEAKAVPDSMVLVPKKIIEMLWNEADPYHMDSLEGLAAVIPNDKYLQFVDWYDENMIQAAQGGAENV